MSESKFERGKIRLTRYEKIPTIPASIGVLQVWCFKNLDDTIKLLTGKTGIDFESMRAELDSNEISSFELNELVCNGCGGYLANVGYQIKHVPESEIVNEIDNEPTPDTLETEFSRGIGGGFSTDN